MEAIKFINLLKRHKYTLIAVPVLVICIAMVLVRNLPNAYSSKASIAAGLADQSQQLLIDKADVQENKTTQAFSNLIQMLQMKNVFDQVSYQLIYHDLTSATPYRKPSKLLTYLNQDARKHALEVYTQLYNTRQPLNLLDNDQKGLNEVIISMKYDYNSLYKKIKIYRVENSDFIDVEYESESPILSAVVVNTLCKEFIDYYTFVTKENGLKSINFLSKLLADKKDTLDTRMQRLKDFKIQNHVLNLNEEAKSLYTQKADFETRIQLEEKDVQSNEGALRSINNKFNPNDRQYVDSKLTLINQEILLSKQKLAALTTAYIKSNFDSSYLPRIDALKATLSDQINQSSDKYILNPMIAKENLVTQKLTLEIALDLAKNSIATLQNELNKLNKELEEMVPNEALVQSYESGITVASQEYLEILNKYNQTNLEYNAAVKLKLIERAAPGELQSSKKLILVAVSGIASLVLCLFVLFILFYIDNSIQSPVELAQKTGSPVMGYLPLLTDTSLLNLKQLWKNDDGRESQDFKNQLRSLRFEIDNLNTSASIINVTSLCKEEGKTLVAMSLASAYLMINKKVLLVDGNFTNPSITEIANPQFYIEDYLTGKASIPQVVGENDIFVLGNKGRDSSLFEVNNEHIIKQKMQALKDEFDIILIESSALDTLNRSKEWNNVVDKVLGVFECNNTISASGKEEVKYLKGMNDKFIGWVLNKVPGEEVITGKKKKFFSRKK